MTPNGKRFDLTGMIHSYLTMAGAAMRQAPIVMSLRLFIPVSIATCPIPVIVSMPYFMFAVRSIFRMFAVCRSVFRMGVWTKTLLPVDGDCRSAVPPLQ